MDKALMKNLRKSNKYSSYLAIENLCRQIDDSTEEIRVSAVRNFTIEMVMPVIAGEIACLGYKPNLLIGNYDNISQELLDKNSIIYGHDPDIIVIAVWLDTLSPRITDEFNRFSFREIENEKIRIIDEVESYILSAKQFSNATILINNFILPKTPVQGIYDLQGECSQLETVHDLNKQINDFARKQKNVYIVDFLSLFYRYGYEFSFNAKTWASAKSPFADKILVPVGREYGKFIRALKGFNKKCIILDCDGTLWGGVVGEDGVHGIAVGQDYPGNCYRAFQNEILNLYHKGVLLAICSKNNEEDVLEALKNNEGMLLREEHFVSMKINWNDKAKNIVSIASELNIGLDSLVFVDDSEFECNLIQDQLPEVEVVHLGADPSQFAGIIRGLGAFEVLSVTEEDLNRNTMYKDDMNRKNLRTIYTSLEEYLEKLNMKVTIFKNNVDMISRIAQLTQKTNQFNLTTKRYTQDHILNFMKDEKYDVLAIKLMDNISDLGTVGVAIVEYDDGVASVDTLILSCRVIGRNVEAVVIHTIVELARTKLCSKVTAKYIPTKKNGQVSELYGKFGFQLIQEDNGTATWELKLANTAVEIPEYIAFETRE